MTLEPADAALARAVSTPDQQPDQPVTIPVLAELAGTSVAVVEAILREGLLAPVDADPPRFLPDDIATVQAGVTLLHAGLPLGELLDLAGRADEALRGLADHAVEVFLDFVRDPVRAAADDDAESTTRLLHAYTTMLPAAADLVGGHFRSLVLAAARDRVASETGDNVE